MGKAGRDRLLEVWSLWALPPIMIRASPDSYCLCHLSSVAVTEYHSLGDLESGECCSSHNLEAVVFTAWHWCPRRAFWLHCNMRTSIAKRNRL